MPQVSVIVPVYKAETYLRRCVDSILVQTFTDFELLLIDDGSPDRSGEICDEYAQKDNRVKVFHKENGGVSSARNYGIEHANCDWLCFVDSDDYISSTYLDDFGLRAEVADIYMQGYVNIKDGKIVCTHNFVNCTEHDLVGTLAYAENNNIINSPWVKLFNRCIVMEHNVRFDERVSYGEDHLFVMNYMQYINTSYYSNLNGYHYVENQTGSLTHKLVSAEQYSLYMKELSRLYGNLLTIHVDDSIKLYVAYSKRVYTNVMNYISKCSSNTNGLQELRAFKKLISNVLKTKFIGLSSKEQVLLVLFKVLSPETLLGLMNCRRKYVKD